MVSRASVSSRLLRSRQPVVRDDREASLAASESVSARRATAMPPPVTPAMTCRPKLQLIAPTATASKVCDVATAIGARPIMGCTDAEEAKQVARLVDATLLSFGTPTTASIAHAIIDDARIVVVDPVGVGIPKRGKMIYDWLLAREDAVKRAETRGEKFKTIIKGNASEIEALLRLYDVPCGRYAEASVTSMNETGGRQSFDELYRQPCFWHPTGDWGEVTSVARGGPFWEPLISLMGKTFATIVMTSFDDIIVDHRTSRIFVVGAKSTHMFDEYAGAGCALGAVCAAFACDAESAYCASDSCLGERLRDASVFYRRAGCTAALDATRTFGPASFQVTFVDELRRSRPARYQSDASPSARQ